jgi:aspartate kinase
MAMALQAEGGKAVSLTGAQAGIRTDAAFSGASVLRADTRRLRRELAAGRIPVVAGFQGATAAGDITTLGRGGSDLTAVVLAGALGSELCEFRTDVKGIYTAHPAMVPEARKIKELSYGELIALAELGTEVRQLRAVRYAEARGIRLHLRSSFHDESGTIVASPDGRAGVSALSLKKGPKATLVSAVGLKLDAGHAEKAMAAAAAAGIDARLRDRSTGRIVLAAAPDDAEKLLKALHRGFFGARH